MVLMISLSLLIEVKLGIFAVSPITKKPIPTLRVSSMVQSNSFVFETFIRIILLGENHELIPSGKGILLSSCIQIIKLSIFDAIIMAIMKFDAPQISWIEPNLSFTPGANSILLLDTVISLANFTFFIISLDM